MLSLGTEKLKLSEAVDGCGNAMKFWRAFLGIFEFRETDVKAI